MRPVADATDACGLDAERFDVGAKALGDDACGGGAPQREAFDLCDQPRRASGAGDATLARRLAHQVLQDDAVGDAEACGGGTGGDAAAQARHHADHGVRARAAQRIDRHHQRRCLVPRPAQRRLRCRHVVRAAVHGDPVDRLDAACRRRVGGVDAPRGVVRHAGHDVDRIPLYGEMLGELRRVRGDAGLFRRIVQRSDEDARHQWPSRRSSGRTVRSMYATSPKKPRRGA